MNTTKSNDQLFNVLLIAFVGAIGALVYNTLPSFLGAAAITYEFDNLQLGALASSYFIGHTAASIIIGLVITRLNLSIVVLSAAIIFAISFLATVSFNELTKISLLLAIAGFSGGAIFVVAMTVLSVDERSTRNIGLLFMVQMILSAIVIYFSTATITPQWGYSGVAVLYVVSFLVVAALFRSFNTSVFLTKVSQQEQEALDKSSSFQWLPLVPLITMVIFFIGYTAVWGFLERMGADAGFDPNFIGLALMSTFVTGAIASGVTMTIENRFGLRVPIGIAVLMSIAGLILLALGDQGSELVYLISSNLYVAGGVATVNSIASAVAYLDKKTTHTALIPAAIGVGIILGPVAGGFISSDSFMPILFLGLVTLFLTMLTLVVFPTLRSIGINKTSDTADV